MQAPNVQLYPGSTDTANVKKLQDYLVGLGLMTQAEVDTGYGVYGPKTTAAVSKLQQKLGVDTSAGGIGNYGPKTSAAALSSTTTQPTTNGGLSMPSINGMPGLTPISNPAPAPAPVPTQPNPFNPSNVNISMPNTSTANSTPATSFGQSNNSFTTPSFADLVKGYQSPTPVTNDTLSVPSNNANVLSIYTPSPKDISTSTSYPVRGNENDPVQSNSIVTPANGSSKASPTVIADAVNAAQGNPTNYTAPDSRGVLSQMIADRAMNRGLYAIEPGMQYSPEQIMARRNTADHFYGTQVAEMMQKEKSSSASMMGDLTTRQSSIVQQVNTSFENSPIVKQYNELQSQYQNMTATVGKGNGANDIATIYTFMKALDPDSVVRETEYNTGASKSGNIFAGALASLNGLIKPKGGFVSDQAKQNILGAINSRFAVKAQQYYNLRQQKVQQLEARGVPSAGDFITNYDFSFDTADNSASQNKSSANPYTSGQNNSNINPIWLSY